MPAHRLVLDEGGVRHTLGDAHRYFPFAELADVELRTRLLRDPVLVLVDRNDHEHVVFAGPDALEIHKALAEHAGTTMRPREAQHWPRRGRALGAWLEAVSASGLGTYRAAGDTSARALAILDDVTASADDRAAAAHLLVRYGEGDVLVATAKLFASRAFPPLVVAAAQLADGGASLIDDDVFMFLSPEDKEGWSLHHRSGTDRHTAAAAEARRQLGLESHSLANAISEKRTSPHHSPAAYRDMSSWIGKSWGI